VSEIELPREAEIRARFDAGDHDGALTIALEAYGDELFGFLVGLSGDHDRAGDVFGAACERIWTALPRFRWECSMRVWMYTIARNELRRAAGRTRRHVPLSAAPSASALIARVKSTTPIHLRSEVKDELARIRAGLDPEDHMLLGLRLDREMAWNDIAQILGSGEPAALTREAAALRKRYERLKERLRELARDASAPAGKRG
jgi:RNA polymerase sigma factor (sigma-70 family)